jgi:signal transduction histidine kinase
VLERFVRTDHARTRNDGGTGLGLAIVNAVAVAHQGTVTITDAALGVTRVEVRLPNTSS